MATAAVMMTSAISSRRSSRDRQTPLRLFSVDMVLEHAADTVIGIEVKAAETVRGEDFRLGDGLHFRRLALDYLPYEQRADLSVLSAAERSAVLAGEEPAVPAEEPDPVEMAQSVPVEHAHHRAEQTDAERAKGADRPAQPHSSTELIESQQGRSADAPLCLTCGTKMRPAGSCYVCEGCGSTSGCS